MSNTVRNSSHKQYGGTCRCQMCGEKNAGKKNNRRVYRENGMVKDEAGRYIGFGNNKQMARKTMRARMKRELNYWNMEDE